MNTQIRSLRRAVDARMLASADDLALVCTFAAGLRNTLLVQLHRQTFGESAVSSLYVVYREADMTFEAIVALVIADDGTRPSDTLLEFIRGVEFETAVMRPLRARVRRHFTR